MFWFDLLIFFVDYVHLTFIVWHLMWVNLVHVVVSQLVNWNFLPSASRHLAQHCILKPARGEGHLLYVIEALLQAVLLQFGIFIGGESYYNRRLAVLLFLALLQLIAQLVTVACQTQVYEDHVEGKLVYLHHGCLWVGDIDYVVRWNLQFLWEDLLKDH